MSILSRLTPNSLRRILHNRWFALVDLTCVTVGVILWELEPNLTWFPLLIAGAPWFLRLAVGEFPFQRTRFDPALAIFIITAAVGVWAAYDQGTAWPKFWLLVGAILLFYAIAGQPIRNLWLIAGFFSLVGVGIAIFYLLTNDWNVQPAKIDSIHRIGFWWMTIRPLVEAEAVHPNDVAGISTIMLPFSIALGVRVWREKRVLLGLLAAAGIVIILITLILTTSRGVWIAIGATLAIVLIWLLSGQLTRYVPLRRGAIFGSVVILLASLSIVYVYLEPDRIIKLADALPGSSQAENRLEMARGALNLIGDYPFTGGGLDAYSGLYSQYILITPNYIIPYSHNVYLDVALEQGVLGFLALGWILLSSIILLLTQEVNKSVSPLRWAVLTGLLVMITHAFVDDIVYGTQNTPLLFLLPGMTVALTRPDQRKITPAISSVNRQRSILMVTLVIAGVIISVYAFRHPLMATLYANRGAVEMARKELISFNTGEWEDGSHLTTLTRSEELFIHALQFDPRNRTAHHRLGLIDMLRRDYPAATTHLEAAYEADKNHRGIWKSLGFSYVWTGQYDRAILFLKTIPEAKEELEIYPWWWRKQEREDLAIKAEEMLKRMESSNSP